MAKGKHSTALFEVIHSANKPGRVAQSLRTPKWWFKSSVNSPVTTPPPAPAFEEPEAVGQEWNEPVEQAPVRSRPAQSARSSGIGFGFDRSKQEMTFRLRYTTVLVTAFGIFVLVGLSYVVGRHLGGGPKVASAEQPSVKELLEQPAQPDVTKVTRPRATQAQAARTVTPAQNSEKNQPPVMAHNTVPSRQNVTSSLVPATADTSSPRKAGLNYLVIQIYPADRKPSAEAARDFFTKNGIPCTIEKTGWTLGNWVTLIGTAGFNKVGGDDFKGYVERTAAIAKTYKTANFDRPEPTTSNAYKWKATDGAQK